MHYTISILRRSSDPSIPVIQDTIRKLKHSSHGCDEFPVSIFKFNTELY